MQSLLSSEKKLSKEIDHDSSNSNIKDKSFSTSLISDTSPVYLFCTRKNGINSKNENGWTPIYRSIIANNLTALNELLNLGSDPNISNNLGETPLYLCVDLDNYDALIMLLKFNADTNISKRNGVTPLHLAAKKNMDKFMHALLRNNANPNLTNKLYSQTPTHLAIINKINEDMLNIFHEYNADIYNIKDKYDKTPFDYAKDLKDEEYIQLIIKIFGEKNNEILSKPSKTFNLNIKKNDEHIINIKKNFHNSNYNFLPGNISINENEIEKKDEIEINNEENKKDNNNNDNETSNASKNKTFVESDKRSQINSILNSKDNLYSDKTMFKNAESNDSRKQNTPLTSENQISINNNYLSEFKPLSIETEPCGIKQKNSFMKNIKSNINIDTKMIDNSKDIIVTNNDNNDSNNIHIKDNYNEKKEEIEINNEKKNENYNDDNNIEYNNVIKTADNKEKRKGQNTDKQIIKNIISSTVKKIKVNTNTYNSEFSSLNNNSITKNNGNSISKEVNKLINFSSNNQNLNNNNLISDNINLEKDINTNSNQLENGTSSFILYNLKKHVIENDTKNGINNDYEINLTHKELNNINIANKISEITPISNQKVSNQISSINSNIFSEVQFNSLNSIQKNSINQTDQEISDNEFLKLNQKSKEDYKKYKEINNSNNKENENSDNKIYDGSFELSKTKSNIVNDFPISNKNQSNNNFPNINNINNNLNQLIQHHRQISYHNNSKSSINKRKKEGEIQNDDSYNNNSYNKENDNPNSQEIIYYTKNYLVGNNLEKKGNELIKNNNNEKDKNKVKVHNYSDINSEMNVQRYNSLTNKTYSINQKIFTYTSPNLNKVTYLINTDLNNINHNINQKEVISNLNGTKEDFFSNNNNLSSFLNTNKLSNNNKRSSYLKETNNNNSTFSVYDENIDTKNLEKKNQLYISNLNTRTNHLEIKKNENKVRNNHRGSSMGNTTLSSMGKNAFNNGKQSLNSVFAKSLTNNNNTNLTNIIFSGRNSNKNNNNNNLNTSNNLIKNIPINMLLRLRDWLISCDLLCYYNLLIENNMYDIDKCINDLQNNKIIISYKNIEDIGIRKPGHIFRLLLKLEIDSGILDNNIFSYILSKFNMSSSISNNIILTSSITDINCCGICNKNRNYQSYIKRNDCPYNDLFSFLKYKDLWKYKENFLHNGFDQLEYVLLQLFSKYTYDKEIMNDCFHIYVEKDKLNVLNKLYEEKKSISLECGINSDDNEIEQIMSNYSYSKRKSDNTSEPIFKANNEGNCCNIF